MKETSIRFVDIRKSFASPKGAVDVLKGMNLAIDPGEFFVLLGPSGCGKSTLLNLAAGLEKPTAGSIVIGDRVVADVEKKIFMHPFERDVAMVFQSYALYPHMTVAQNIAFPLSNLRPKPPKSEQTKRVSQTAALLQIEELLDRKPRELSGGQRQRVAIGRAIVREPDVFLLDEPLSNLDAQLRMDMRAHLKALQKKLGITSLYVTHDQMEAMTLGDRIAVINNGVIEQLGTPVDVYDKPATPFVARFIGSPPMNLFEGDVSVENEVMFLRTGALTIRIPPQARSRIENPGFKRCILGIRPEHITLVPKGTGNVDVRIGVTENIGAEYLIYVFVDGGQIVVRAPRKPESEDAGLRFDGERVHVFGV